MKKLITIMLMIALVMIPVFANGEVESAEGGASTGSAAPAATARREAITRPLKVGFIATNFSAETQAKTAQSFESICKERGWEVTLLNSQGSIETQATQMENLIQMKVDAIVIAMAHPTEIKPAIDAANAAGIPVIAICSGYTDGLVCDIAANDFVMGAKISSYLLDSLGGSGNIVVIKFTKNAGCRKRGEVLDAMLPEYPDIHVLGDYTVAGTSKFMDDTAAAMETFVTKFGDKIDGVWCAFDQLSFACIDVIESAGLKNVMVTGVDGGEETERRIKDGRMSATVSQPFEEMALKAVEIIEKMAAGMDPKAAAGANIVYVDAPLLTAADL